MSDDTNRTAQDRKLISLSEDYEVRDWSASMQCSEEELRQALKVVGYSAEAVRSYLHGSRK